jgi:hypothetical protein
MTHLQSALPLASLFYWAFVVFALAKLASSAGLLFMGDYKAEDVSLARRLVRIISKITPSLACLSLAGTEYLRGNPVEAAGLILFAAAIAWFAAFILLLRRQRKFFGLADRLSQYLSPSQIRAVGIIWLGAVLFVLLRTLH